MLNLPFLKYIAVAEGKCLAALISERWGISEVRARNNSAKLHPSTLARSREFAMAEAQKRLTRAGMTEEQARRWLDAHPGIAGGRFYASLVYEAQVPGVLDFHHTLQLARELDDVSERLTPLIDRKDGAACLKILDSTEVLTAAYFAPDPGACGDSAHDARSVLAENPNDPLTLNRAIGMVTANSLLSLLASWDVEFTARFFPGQAPRSLFVQLMPDIDPRAWNKETSGFKPRRDFLYRPIRRLLSLTWYIARWLVTPDQIPPAKPPSVALLSRETEIATKKLTKWRTGAADLSSAQFGHFWGSLMTNLGEAKTAALRLDHAKRADDKRSKVRKNQPVPPVPFPLYIAATFWSEFLIQRRESRDSVAEVQFVQDDYLAWWERHRLALAAKNCSFGSNPWPATLDQL